MWAPHSQIHPIGTGKPWWQELEASGRTAPAARERGANVISAQLGLFFIQSGTLSCQQIPTATAHR